MRTIDPNDIVAALAHCDQEQLAAALSASPEPAFARLSRAVLTAAEHKAAYPRDEVITEADALLYDVLRWPVEDATPSGITVDPTSYAQHKQVSITEAERVLHHVAATESQACDQLLASGITPNFTLEQSQVYDCIVNLRLQHRVPTRHLVRQHATRIAASAMRPGEGADPIIYSDDPALAPRVVSPSPKTHVLIWLDRMDANPPQAGLLEERIAFLSSAKAEMGQASSRAAELRTQPIPPAARTRTTTEVGRSLSLAG